MKRLLASPAVFRLLSALAFVVLAGAACSQSQTAPTDVGGVGIASFTDAKPGPAPPASLYSVSFAPPSVPGSDGGYSPGHIQWSDIIILTGNFTGSSSTGNLLGTATGPATLTITDVGPLPPGASTPGPCPDGRNALAAAGVLGPALSGTLTIDVDQDGEGGGGFRHSQLTWQMTDITHGGATWKSLKAAGTFNYPAAYDETPTGFTVTLENGAIAFNRYPTGSRKADLTVGCRVDLVMTVTQQP